MVFNQKEYIQKYRQTHLEEIKEYYKIYYPKYYKQNKDKIRERCKQWDESHKEWRKNYHKKHYLKNKEKYSMQRKQYRQIHKEKVRKNATEYARRQGKINLQFLISYRLRNLLRDALQKYSNGKIQSTKKYGIDWNVCCKKLIETKPTNFREKTYHIDHLKPLSSFDLTDIKQVGKAFSPDNLQWLTAEENIAKGNKIIGVD